MEKITLFLKDHRGCERLFASFQKDYTLINIIKKIPGITYSGTNRAWYMENSEDNLKEIFRLFKDVVEVDATAIVSDYNNELRIAMAIGTNVQITKNEEDAGAIANSKLSNAYDSITIEVTDKKIFIKMPKNVEDISFLNSFNYARFNKNNFMWEVPNYKNTLQIIKEYFGKRITEVKVNSASTSSATSNK